MKWFIILSACIAVTIAADDFCYKDAEKECGTGSLNGESLNCNSLFSGYKHAEPILHKYVHANIKKSYEYLLLTTYYGNYVMNRPGFEKVFRELSDKAWSNTIDLIKHITKRGGKMIFSSEYDDLKSNTVLAENSEFQAMAQALDSEKYLAKKAHELQRHVSVAGAATKQEHYDPALAHYIEEEFLEYQTGTIRKLSGYTNDLKNLLNQSDASLAVYLFDEYLQKQ